MAQQVSVYQHLWCSWWEHTGWFAQWTLEDVTRAVPALGVIVPILGQFDLDNNVAVPSGKHSLASAECDRDAIVSELIKYGVFESCKDRYLTGVPKPKKELIFQQSTHK